MAWQIPVAFVATFIGGLLLTSGKKKENKEQNGAELTNNDNKTKVVTGEQQTVIYESKPSKNDIIKEARPLALKEIKEKEGYKLEVYKDTLGNPTVGYGHLVLEGDNLQVGDKITKEKANEFLEKDFEPAFNAAISQATELNKVNSEFIAALTSVNYQLGTSWRSKFPNTWAALKAGNIRQAIDNLKASKWNEQTPVRVTAFIGAIQNAFA